MMTFVSAIIALVAWGISAYLAMIMARLSINETIVLLVGLGDVACFGAAFYFLVWREKAKFLLGFMSAIAPAPALIVILFVTSEIDRYIVPLFEVPPAEYTAACKDAGEHVFRYPSKPVHSIAFSDQSMVTRYKIGLYGRLEEIGGFPQYDPRFNKAIKFIEVREPGAAQRYKRTWQKSSNTRQRHVSVDVNAPSADILVTYHTYRSGRWATTHELTVTDRRDGALLAKMKYTVDEKDRRICGPIHNGVLSENDFLTRALNLR